MHIGIQPWNTNSVTNRIKGLKLILVLACDYYKYGFKPYPVSNTIGIPWLISQCACRYLIRFYKS